MAHLHSAIPRDTATCSICGCSEASVDHVDEAIFVLELGEYTTSRKYYYMR